VLSVKGNQSSGPDRIWAGVSSESDETISADEVDYDARAQLGALPVGYVFANRYEIEALIGRGGMGIVYKVRDRQLDETVALKLLTLSAERSVERFQREVRLARRVTHPNVARTHDIGSHDGVHFLTMEYVQGTPLDTLVEEGAVLEPEKVARIGAQIAAGLESAHAAGVVHRDLKPGNVLIGEDGRVVLTDFGIARATRADTRTHETGAVVGTPYYMAPEQVTGAAVDGRTDIYALGLIMYELATGNFPFDADTPLAIAVVRLHSPPLDPRTFASIPDPLADVILRCIARDPSARFQSASALHEALVALKGGATAPPRPPTESGTSSIGSLYAPISPGRRALAILPFVYRGDPEHDYLGEGLAEELIDTLSRTKGLRVIALGATKRFAEHRDPARIGIELSADFVVDGTVQLAKERVRIAARLVETDSGVQRWSERFDGAFEDVFSLQETMGQRVAESLRLEVDAAAHRRTAPQEAIELYLRARRFLRTDVMMRADEAVEMLEKCLELAPAFTPAVPALAMASLRAWWSRQEARGPERGVRAREHVAYACKVAPDMAETHFAQAMLANQDGRYKEAAQALAKTLEIAPTMPEAHWYLGEMQLESGRWKEGKKRLQLALELDPSLNRAYLGLARIAAFEGDYALANEHLTRIQDASIPSMPILAGRVRYAMWNNDVATMRSFAGMLARVPGEGPEAFARLLKVALGEAAAEEMLPVLEMLPGWLGNRRFTSLVQQIAVEVFAFAGEHELALDVLERSAEAILTDVEWIRRCPPLAPLRSSPRFEAVAAKVEERAANTWSR
jgi:serine/threonine protein kinase/tetratricopeptide (TPR) repeat protein